MNIAATQYTLSRRAYEIYISGCDGYNGVHCKDCHNPELWDASVGEPLSFEKIMDIRKIVSEFGNLVQNVMIFGGEPLERPKEEIVWLLQNLSFTEKPIWLFTRFELDEIDIEIKQLCDYIKCGCFMPELKTVKENVHYNIPLGSSNQRVYKHGVDY